MSKMKSWTLKQKVFHSKFVFKRILLPCRQCDEFRTRRTRKNIMDAREINYPVRYITRTHLWSYERSEHYRQTSNISRTLVGNRHADHSDVVGATPIGAAPTTSSFATHHLAPMDWPKTTTRRDEKQLSFRIWCACIRGLAVYKTPLLIRIV